MATLRQAVMSLALVATVAATAWFALQADPAADVQDLLAAPQRAAAPARMQAVAPSAVAVPPATVLANTPRFAKADGNLFAVRHWQAAPLAGAPVVEAAPPPEPPPALPFKYLGKLVEGGEVVVFLAQGNQIHLARRGDVLAGYRVDELRADGMRFTHLARNAPYDLAFGSGN